MSERSSEGRAERINEELRDYKGFPAVLSQLQRTEGDFGGQSALQQLSIDRIRAATKRTPDEERATQEAALNALIARPEIAALVQRMQEADEEQRSRALRVLFPSSETRKLPEE